MNKGFSLIELLVVISIISLVSSIIMTNLNEVRSSAKVAAIIKFEQSIYRANAHHLAGHWSLEEAGTNFADSINNNNGVGTGLLTSVKGVIGNGVDFGGGRITIANDSALQITGDLSISMYLFPHQFEIRRNPINKAYGGEGTITQEDNGTLSFYYGTAGSNSSPYTSLNTGANTLIANEWNHILIVKNTATSTTTWWINGEQVTQMGIGIPQTTASANDLIIGDGYTNPFDGIIDEVKIYNAAVI